jgi:hypothetical protein
LRESDFGSRVLNTRSIPFPSHGNQKVYRASLRHAITKANLR